MKSKFVIILVLFLTSLPTTRSPDGQFNFRVKILIHRSGSTFFTNPDIFCISFTNGVEDNTLKLFIISRFIEIIQFNRLPFQNLLISLFLQTATFQCHRDNALCYAESSVGPELDQPRKSKWVLM